MGDSRISRVGAGVPSSEGIALIIAIRDGEREGTSSVGLSVGASEKPLVGTEVSIVGVSELPKDGLAVWLSVVGSAVGLSVGLSVKEIVGISIGDSVGETGLSIGPDEGTSAGDKDKVLLGLKETEGEAVVSSV